MREDGSVNAFELARYRSGLSIKDAAANAEVNERTIARIESGEIQRPSAPVVNALARVYNVDVAALLGVGEAA